MKLLEIVARCRVIKFSNGESVYSGSCAECIKFIKSFDAASPIYVDLRLIGPDNQEIIWH